MKKFDRAVLAVACVAGGLVPCLAAAQGNLSTQGMGYPTGGMSTAALAAGGGTAEFDPMSPLNPAALASLNMTQLHVQYDPEFRTLTGDSINETSTTSRFPDFVAAMPVSSRLVLGVSLATLLDRSWETDVASTIPVGDTTLQSVTTFQSTGALNDIRVGAGFRAARWLHIGLSVDAFTGENRILIERTFADTDTTNTAPFQQNTIYQYRAWGGSAGVVLFPTGPLSIAASYEGGGELQLRLNDSLAGKASVPPRVGGDVRYRGIPGLSFGLRAEWQGWSRLAAFGGEDAGAKDSWDIGGGVDISGPHTGPNAYPVILHLGAREQDLPFLAEGQVVHETDFSGGLSLPIGGPRGLVDLALQHANRTANLPFTESAWTVSVGLTVRP